MSKDVQLTRLNADISPLPQDQAHLIMKTFDKHEARMSIVKCSIKRGVYTGEDYENSSGFANYLCNIF